MSINSLNYYSHFCFLALALFFLWYRSTSGQALLFYQQSHPQKADNSSAFFAHLCFLASFPPVQVFLCFVPHLCPYGQQSVTLVDLIFLKDSAHYSVFLLLLGSVIFWSQRRSGKKLYQVVTVPYSCSASLVTLPLRIIESSYSFSCSSDLHLLELWGVLV